MRSNHSSPSRHSIHSLSLYDPEALKWIKLIKASYFESSETKPPVPRNQDLPPQAFGELTGRCILACTSHAWFWQSHPDPEGVKLKLLREFIQRLRKRYPNTKIVIFDDWHSCPQWPRTKKEDEIFHKAMAHMNSMYLYCDVVLFLEAKLPDLDMTVRFCTLIPANYSFGTFVDVTQFHGPESDNVSIRKNDIVVTPSDLDILKSTSNEIVISYLKRPFGRPNRIPVDKRGWLYAERFTIAVKVATAGEHRFEDIVWSNNEELRTTIYTWARMLLAAVKRDEIGIALEEFKMELKKKQFTRPDDTKVVGEIVEELVNQFANDWKGEVEKQKSMSKRVREILLRWGEFSEQYVERAGFLRKENDVFRTLIQMLLLLVCPVLTLYMFCFDVSDDPLENSNLSGSLFVGATFCIISSITSSILKVEFLGVTPGLYTILNIGKEFVQHFLLSCLLRLIFSPFPLEILCTTIITVVVGDQILYGPKYVSATNPRTNEKVRLTVKSYIRLPAKYRFNPKIYAELKLIETFDLFMALCGFAYPILGGIFFNSGILAQSCIIPIFYFVRASFEFGADAWISKSFGSDGMPVICLIGVGLHEVCLTLMMTNISHPLIFAMLVLCDVMENAFCLWCLHRTMNMAKSNKVLPRDYSIVVSSRKTLTKRSSSVYNLVRDLDHSTSMQERQGTALFIAATLLQREMIETFVPIQAGGIFSIMYNLKVKSNSMVSSWTSNEEYQQTMIYMGIDLGVEILVFAITVVTLRNILPDISAWRVLSGLLKMHFYPMLMFMFLSWYVALVFQSTQCGMDTSFKFSWLECSGKKNSTWLGGFDWEC